LCVEESRRTDKRVGKEESSMAEESEGTEEERRVCTCICVDERRGKESVYRGEGRRPAHIHTYTHTHIHTYTHTHIHT
jgi:hypothetical protein